VNQDDDPEIQKRKIKQKIEKGIQISMDFVMKFLQRQRLIEIRGFKPVLINTSKSL